MKYATVKDELPMTIIYLIKYAQYIPVKTMNVESTLLCSINSTNVIDLADKFLFKKRCVQSYCCIKINWIFSIMSYIRIRT